MLLNVQKAVYLIFEPTMSTIERRFEKLEERYPPDDVLDMRDLHTASFDDAP